MKILFVFLLIFLTPIGVHAARCNVNGKWYPYSDPICSGGEQKSSPSINNAKNNATTPPSPIEEVTAEALYEAFEANEVAAEVRYKNKTIVVTGTVTDINTNIAGQPIVYLKAGTMLWHNISCRFPKTSMSQLVDMHKGETVSLSCSVGSRILTAIHLSDCSIKIEKPYWLH